MSRETNSRRQQLFQKNHSPWCQREPGFCPYMLFSPAGWALVSPSVRGGQPASTAVVQTEREQTPRSPALHHTRVSRGVYWFLVEHSTSINKNFIFLSIPFSDPSNKFPSPKKKKWKKPPVTLTIHSHHLLGWIENDHKKKPNITITLKEMTLVSDWSQLASRTDSFLSFRESTKYQHSLLRNIAFTAT